GHECSSFEYDARSQECSIHSEDGQPFGASVLTKTDGPIAFFQQMCVQGKVMHLCCNTYGFDDIHKACSSVILAAGLSECLSKCLTAPASLHTQCRSAMFFYETGECIINRERRSDWPELFIDVVQDQLVDYFENNCQDVHCFNGQLHWIRTEEYYINHEKDVIIESMSIENVRAVCEESRCLAEFGSTSVHNCLAGCLEDGAHCATAVFNYEKDRCSLSETSQFSHPELFVKAENVDYFDKICDPVAAEKRTESIAERDVVVEGVTSNSIEDEEQQDDDDRVVSLRKQYAPRPPPISFLINLQLYLLTVVSSQINLQLYLLTVFNFLQKSTVEGRARPRRVISKSNVVEQKEAQAEGVVIDDTAEFQRDQQTPVKARLTTECLMSGVTVKVELASETSGAIYIKENFATCRTEFTNATEVELHIPFPESDDPDPRCPGTEIAPSIWSFSVVIQKNEINAPSLVTSVDRVFNVTCNYVDLLGRILPRLQSAKLLKTKPSRIELEILRNGRAVTTVPLGDEVELRWRILEQSPGHGYFVDSCIAERVGGAPPHPEPLNIIKRGCPDEKINNRLIKSPIVREPDGFSTKMK
ncbi:PAN domain protein, partial [Ostertagia ostertagi]